MWFSIRSYYLVFTVQGGHLIGQCVFWEIGQSHRTWQTRGCVRVDHESNARSTTCECDHLTIFSVLLNNEPVRSTEIPFCHFFLSRTNSIAHTSLYCQDIRHKKAFLSLKGKRSSYFFRSQENLCFRSQNIFWILSGITGLFTFVF